MPLIILLLIILGVYAEFAVIIEVGGEIGAAATLFAMFATAVIGLWLVRLQGLDVFKKMNAATAKGETPVKEMMHGFLLLLAGFLLIIPGFITDAVGALLLIPPIRSLLISLGIGKQTRVFYTWRQQSGRPPGQGGTTIEGEYTSDEEKEADKPKIGSDRD